MNNIDLNGSSSPLDRILTLENYWDGPQHGLCTFNGEYCVYERIFSEELDEFSDYYYLTPVSETIAQKKLEIWHKWCEFMSNGGNAGDWKCDVDTEDLKITESTPLYREFKKLAVFRSVFPGSVSEEFNELFVEWI